MTRPARPRHGARVLPFARTILRPASAWLGLGLGVFAGARESAAAGQTIRVVAYNIEADVNGNTAPNSGLATVLEAIGENYVNGAAHPLDLLALEETTSNPATVSPIVTALNAYYGANTYALSTVQGGQHGSATVGNGPNALVYNAKTLRLLDSVGVGTPAGAANGEYRQVMRYLLQPYNGTANTQFYVYVSHMKSSASGTTAAVQAARAKEAAIIVADLKKLPANGGVLVMGDFNLDGSTEAVYQTLTAPGTYQLLDPLNPTLDYTQTWNTAAYLSILSDATDSLDYRDDIQFMSAAVYRSTNAAGLRYVAGSETVFGNNGSVALHKAVDAATNTALDGLQGPITPATARAALVTASDHLPVVADYTVDIAYATWLTRFFTAAEQADLTVSGNAADPDGDGIPNLLEYALGLSPRSVDTNGLPTVGKTTINGNTYLTLTCTQVFANTDITYMPQVSSDLATWNSGANYVATVSAQNNPDALGQTVVVRDLTPLAAAGRRFIRLKVTMP